MLMPRTPGAGHSELRSHLERFFDRLIFRPHRAFSRKLFYLRFAYLLAQCSHEFLVAPLLSRLALPPEFLELQIDVADDMRRTARS